MGERTRINSKIMRLPPDIRDHVDQMLLNTAITYPEISEWLKEQGYEISVSAVGRHAVHNNRAKQRAVEKRELLRTLAQAMDEMPDVDYTKVTRLLMMEGLMQKVLSAEDEFLEMPLDKAGRLISSLSRTEVYSQKARNDLKGKLDLAFEAMEERIMETIGNDPALAPRLREVLSEAREKLVQDEE